MKDKRLQIYCTSTFFMHVFRMQKELSSEGELSRNIFSLFRHSKVNVEAGSSEILRKTIPPEIFLAYPTIGLHPNKEDFALIEKGEPSFFLQRISSSSLFFLDSEEEKCVLLEQRFGIVCVSLHKFHKARFLFSWHLESIFRGNNIFDWGFLKRYQHPHNALLISDNYLFSELTRPKSGPNAVSERIQNDIIPIVDALLPTYLNEEIFQLTIIFVQDIEEAKEKNESTRIGIRDNRPQQALEEIAKAIERALQNLRRKRSLPKQIELSLVKRFSNVNRSETHDRHILTNYMWINSGYGFALGSVKKDFNTTIKAFPISYLNHKFKGYGSADLDEDTEMIVWKQYCELLNVFKNVQMERRIVIPRNAQQNRLIPKSV